MGDELLDKLRAEVDAGRVVFVVGAGVSIGATGRNPLAGWPGLLKHGVGRCVELLGSKLAPDWTARQLDSVERDAWSGRSSALFVRGLDDR